MKHQRGLTLLGLGFLLTWPGAVAAQTKLIDPKLGIGDNLTNIYNNSIEILLWAVMLMLIVSGYIYITSMGSPDRVKLAKELLVSTLIGGGLLLALPLILESLGMNK